MLNKELVSVIIPVYNGGRYLAGAIENVLAQEPRPVEIIVVNDGSTDNTETIAGHYERDIIYARQENHGPGAARNKGLQIASGGVVGFLDVDDLWSENKLPVQLRRLAGDLSAEIVLGLSQPMKLQIGEEDKLKFEKWYDPFCAFVVGAAVFKKPVFDRVGFFDETLYFGEDTDWFMRAREMEVKLTILQEVCLFYRRHGSIMTLDAAERNRYLIRAFKKSLDRRRERGDGVIVPLAKVSYPENVISALRALRKGIEKASDADANRIDADR
jgi:glycosyltransferase involved in cell wall biosynthesis